MINIYQLEVGLCSKLNPLGLWQLKLMAAYYSRNLDADLDDEKQEDPIENKAKRLVSDELLEAAINATQQWLHDWQKGKNSKYTYKDIYSSNSIFVHKITQMYLFK